MALHDRSPGFFPAESAADGHAASWFSLLASSIGVPQVSTTHAEIRADGARLAKGPLRVVVQEYATGRGAQAKKPVSSAQRTVTAEELRRGVRVRLIDVTGRAGGKGKIVAWVEPGEANLELDGREARPGKGSVMGMARGNGGRAEIVLRGPTRAA